MFATGEVRLGACILDKVKHNMKEQAAKKRKAVEKATSKYADAVRKSEEIKQTMAMKNITANKLKNTELMALFRALK